MEAAMQAVRMGNSEQNAAVQYGVPLSILMYLCIKRKRYNSCVHLYLFVYVCLSVCLSVSVSLCLPVSVCLSISLSISLARSPCYNRIGRLSVKSQLLTLSLSFHTSLFCLSVSLRKIKKSYIPVIEH